MLPVSRDDPPISPSPSFSSVFHSSCFLHKAGVSRDSSQMFSAAHHIAFLMKYSWSLSASCHESLLQLPAMETLRRQHSCKAPAPCFPLGTSTFLFLLPPAVPERGFVPSRLAGEDTARATCGDTAVPKRSPTPRMVPPWLGGGGTWMQTPGHGVPGAPGVPNVPSTPGAPRSRRLPASPRH